MFRSFFLSRRWALWAWGGLLVLVALVFITVQQTVKLNAWYGEFYDLLQKPEQAGGLEKFWGFMLQFAWIAFPFMLLRSLETYLASHFAFRWRQAMTEDYLPRWQRMCHGYFTADITYVLFNRQYPQPGGTDVERTGPPGIHIPLRTCCEI